MTLTTSAGSYDITSDSSNNALDWLAEAINVADAGVTATIITDSDGARLVLKGGVGEDEAFTLTNGGGADANLARFTWDGRSEEHTSELQSLMRISYAVFCLKKKK